MSQASSFLNLNFMYEAWEKENFCLASDQHDAIISFLSEPFLSDDDLKRLGEKELPFNNSVA